MLAFFHLPETLIAAPSDIGWSSRYLVIPSRNMS
jgi:hypothetical protein